MSSVAPFGRWPSPLTADVVAVGRTSLSELQSDGVALYWLEARPLEGGRTVLVRFRDGRRRDHSPDGVSIRSRVHEYGGGAVTVVPHHAEGAFAYVDQGDQRVWFCDGEGAVPRPLSPASPADEEWRHGGLSTSVDGPWVLAVREVLQTAGGKAPQRSVVAINVNAPEPGAAVVLSGHDFYGTARLDHNGARVVATAWDHPDMPWDRSLIVVAPVKLAPDPSGQGDTLVADGAPWVIASSDDRDASVGQPSWRKDGSLLFVSDRAGWWQPHSHPGVDDGQPPQPMTVTPAEFHGPDWNLGQRTLAELSDGTLVARMTSNGRDSLVMLDGQAFTSKPRVVTQPCVAISTVIPHGAGIAFIGATPSTPTGVYATVMAPDVQATAGIATAATSALAPHHVALAEPIEVTGRTGRRIHANLYRPTLQGTEGPPSQRPPLIVFCHSGPTTAAPQAYDPAIQFFTTRGFAVAAPNYAGSSGYGRTYREALNGQWGIADAHDCLDTALSLAQAQVDASRMAIRGSSAGGFTALNALAAGEGFAACASWYGVTDLLTLVATTHDFEAHYNDRLIGPLPAAEALYRERSPLAHAAEMHGAVLLLQGSEDPVVPAAQARQLHDALVSAGRTCELHIFEGEGHGFRRAETLTAAYELELAFYRTHLNL